MMPAPVAGTSPETDDDAAVVPGDDAVLMLQHSTPVTPERHDSFGAIAWNLFLLVSLMTWPRVVILAFWIFGSELGQAFGSPAIPIVGFFVLPWTTMAYAFMWSISSEAVSGVEWIAVAFGVLFDVWGYAVLQRLRAAS